MLISKLNPILRGWANYFAVSNAKKTFQKVSFHVNFLVRNWSFNKHRNAARRVTYDKYFKKHEGKSHTFFGKSHKGNVITMYHLGGHRVKHGQMIKLSANPFTPDGRQILDKRRLARAKFRTEVWPG